MTSSYQAKSFQCDLLLNLDDRQGQPVGLGRLQTIQPVGRRRAVDPGPVQRMLSAQQAQSTRAAVSGRFGRTT